MIVNCTSCGGNVDLGHDTNCKKCGAPAPLASVETSGDPAQIPLLLGEKAEGCPKGVKVG